MQHQLDPGLRDASCGWTGLTPRTPTLDFPGDAARQPADLEGRANRKAD